MEAYLVYKINLFIFVASKEGYTAVYFFFTWMVYFINLFTN